jgi:choline-sulfatase
MGKQNLFDHSICVPLLISGPDISKGKQVDVMLYQHSLFATTYDLAGITIPKTVEFTSLADLIMGNSERVKYDAMFCYMEWNIPSYRMSQRMVRTKSHKLIVYPLVGVTQRLI